ncbi:MAG: hypothetical protein JWR80_8224, partial [Bradyrhizobium sp.]|nr:hypothetical protein [Bradyrhizobium sp.]
MRLKNGIREIRQADEPVFAKSSWLLDSSALPNATVAKPDLAINSFGVNASTFSAGDQISLSGAVANIGSTSAGAFSTRVFLSTDTVIGGSDTVLWTYTTASLNTSNLANFASTATLPSNLAPGTYYVGVWTDYLGQVDESNENNNATSIAITIKAATQSTSYSLTPPSTTVAEGAGTLTFTITRSGGLPAETVYASTLFDTATSASGDYDPLVNKAISFAANQTTQSFTVHVNQDSTVESTEHFRVMIGATTGAGSAQALDISDIYITDDDAPPPNKAPVVTGTATVNLTVGQTVAASTLFTSATDADGTVAKIRFWDSTHETGYFIYDGQKVTAGYVDVTPAQLSKLSYVTGSTAGKNDIVIEAFDNLGLDSNDLAVRINIAAAPPSSTVDSVREGTDTQSVLQQGQSLTGKIDAEPITGDGVTSDQQGGLVDKDWYRVTLERGHLYTFSGSSLSLGTGKVAISLYDVNGVTAQSAVEGSSPSFSFDTSGQSVASQTYYVAVSAGGAEPAWRTATGDYSIKYVDNGTPAAAPDDWADDPHDTGRPGALTTGGNLAGAIEHIGDYDYFTVYLAAGNTYHLSVAGETRSGTGKIDTVALSLRSSTDFDTRLQSDGGFGVAGFDYDIKQTGTYYIRVGAGSDASDIGGYRVSVSAGRTTPARAPAPSPPAETTALDRADIFLHDLLDAVAGASVSTILSEDFWYGFTLTLQQLDSNGTLQFSHHMAEKLSGYTLKGNAISIGANIIEDLNKFGYNPRGFVIAVADAVAAFAFDDFGAALGAGAGLVAGGPLGGAVGFFSGTIVSGVFYTTLIRGKLIRDTGHWYDNLVGSLGPTRAGADGAEAAAPISPDDLVSFDEAFYLASHPDVAAEIAAGAYGSARAHFLTVGIDLNYQPNANQVLARSDLAFAVLSNDPAALANTALFTQPLGNFAGDGVGSGEGAVATALANAAGVAHGAALDAELSAIAHRKALDLAVNASLDALAGAHATNSSWASQWSNGSDFRQAFAGDFEDLLGPNAPDAAYRLFVVPSSSGTPADVLAKLQAQHDWSGSGFDTLGIAEYAGLWVVIVADRADGVAAVAPDADTLSQVSIYGTAQGESLYAGLRSGRLFGMDGDDTLIGGGGSDTLDGGAGDDVIYAGLGNDIIEGGAGRDLSYGQGGADTFVFKPGDSLYATYDVIYDFEAGVDRIDLTALYTPTLLLATVLSGASTFLFADADGDGTWEFALQLENARITGDDIVLPAALGPIGLIAYGTTGDDQLVGGAGGDVLVGDIGADRLTGGAGKDALNGGAGNDWLDGGSGSDVAIYAVSRSQATVTRDAVAHTLIVNAGTEGTDTLIRTEQVQFSDGLYSFNFANAGAPVVADFAVGAGGWSSQTLYPRHVADVNGDGFGDIVGF